MFYDIITFGSGTKDIYLISDGFKIIGEKRFVTQKGLCLSLGSKIEAEDIIFRIGGGGTNTAATFKNQGFKTAWCGAVGQDSAGQEIINELKKRKIDFRFIKEIEEKLTNHSVVLTYPGKDRTILVYRGASGLLSKKDIAFSQIKTKWIYIAPLSGKVCSIFEYLVNYAKKNNIKVAANPGNSQLSLPKSKLKRIFKKIDILILNQEETSLVTKIPFQKEKKVFKKLDKWVNGIVVMTKGPDGAVISDGKYIYTAKAPKSKVIDRTGAGDSFASGFVSGFIKKKDISFAIQLAMANSSACLKKWGAKKGLLKKGEAWRRVRVKKIKI